MCGVQRGRQAHRGLPQQEARQDGLLRHEAQQDGLLRGARVYCGMRRSRMVHRRWYRTRVRFHGRLFLFLLWMLLLPTFLCMSLADLHKRTLCRPQLLPMQLLHPHELLLLHLHERLLLLQLQRIDDVLWILLLLLDLLLEKLVLHLLYQ
jgi:hypothetical protein